MKRSGSQQRSWSIRGCNSRVGDSTFSTSKSLKSKAPLPNPSPASGGGAQALPLSPASGGEAGREGQLLLLCACSSPPLAGERPGERGGCSCSALAPLPRLRGRGRERGAVALALRLLLSPACGGDAGREGQLLLLCACSSPPLAGERPGERGSCSCFWAFSTSKSLKSKAPLPNPSPASGGGAQALPLSPARGGRGSALLLGRRPEASTFFSELV